MKITAVNKKKRLRVLLRTQCYWEREIKLMIDGMEESKVGNHEYKVGKRENERKREEEAWKS